MCPVRDVTYVSGRPSASASNRSSASVCWLVNGGISAKLWSGSFRPAADTMWQLLFCFVECHIADIKAHPPAARVWTRLVVGEYATELYRAVRAKDHVPPISPIYASWSFCWWYHALGGRLERPTRRYTHGARLFHDAIPSARETT